MNPLFYSSGAPLTLLDQIGGGGEGNVFSVAGQQNIVAKLYHRLPDSEKSSKLRAMVGLQRSSLASISAWPLDTVHLKPQGPLAGFLMPKLGDQRPVHNLSSPRDRKQYFPGVDWSFLVHTARNMAIAVHAVHEAGLVIGDINENSVFISTDATVRFIDCDSFQIPHNGSIYRCKVGVPLFTAPELVGLDLSTTLRTTNHDCYGLAVMIFHLLMMGRHPFAGRYSGREDMAIEKSIATFRYAYGRNAASKGMSPPPNALLVDSLPSDLGVLFETAFSEQAVKGKRPSAIDWAKALGTLSSNLFRCKTDTAHVYFRDLRECPWCKLTKSSGIIFFAKGFSGLVSDLRSGEYYKSFETVLQRIRGIQPPSLPALIDHTKINVTGTPVDPAILVSNTKGSYVAYWGALNLIVATFLMICFPQLWFLWIATALALWHVTKGPDHRPLDNETQRRIDVAKQRELQYHTLLKNYHHSPTPSELAALLKTAGEIEQEHKSMPSWKKKLEDELRGKAQARQLHQFLDRFAIRSADIPGIGDGRKSVLRSFNIESAADINRSAIGGIRGFGPKLISSLMNWRHQVEASFRFDPTNAITKDDLRNLDITAQQYQRDLLHRLIALARRVEEAVNRASMKAAEAKAMVDRAAHLLAQAKADVEVAQAVRRPA